jgi:hypothetical protein
LSYGPTGFRKVDERQGGVSDGEFSELSLLLLRRRLLLLGFGAR